MDIPYIFFLYSIISLPLSENSESRLFIPSRAICFSNILAPKERESVDTRLFFEWSDNPTLQLNFLFKICIFLKLKSFIVDG